MKKIHDGIHRPKSLEKPPSNYFLLELSLVCMNCGAKLHKWTFAGDGPTHFPFTHTACEYCGTFRFSGSLYVRTRDTRDRHIMKEIGGS